MPTYNSTYKKSLLLALSVSTFFLLLFVSLYLYTIKEENNDYLVSKKNFGKEIDSQLNSSWNAYESQIVDMSFWDQFVTYLSDKNEKWFDFYIGTAIDVYHLDLISVYQLNGNLVDARIRGNFNKNIIPKKLLDQLYQKKFLSFFIKDRGIIYKVYGSTIHPSNDPEKKTAPAGYFFMALRLDKPFFQKIIQISSAKEGTIEIIDNNTETNDIQYLKPILDWKGYKIGTFYFSKPTHRDFKTAKTTLIIIIISFILVVLIFIYYSKKWIFTPLNLITNILENPKNNKNIDILKHFKGEFGHIGELFDENIQQQQHLVKAKKQAEKSDKLKSIFLANLSHEIRTPINAINGFTELLLNTKTSTKDKKEYLDVINKSGQNLVSIIDDLIAMSKIESNLITPNLSSFDLDKSMHILFESVKITIPETKVIDFVLESPKQKLKKYAISDEIKLKQIVINLLNNAIKFTEKGKVTLRYEIDQSSNLIHFYISDTGIGIHPDNKMKIFDRFRRIESDLSIKVGGLGLGLAISKAYIELLGGQIELESELNKGTTFHFFIPLQVEEKSKISSNIPDQPLETNPNFTILIAEDDNINFLLFQKIVKDLNYTIIRAKDGQEALEICQKNPNIQLILMDIKMPVLNGYEAVGYIRLLHPKTPIIAQTAYSAEEDKIKILSSGFNDYISKPLDRSKLISLINKYIVN